MKNTYNIKRTSTGVTLLINNKPVIEAENIMELAQEVSSLIQAFNPKDYE